MTKQQQKTSVILAGKQGRAILALFFEREEIARRANKEIVEINEAFQEQGRVLALIHQLPHNDGRHYRFETVEVEGRPRVKLTSVEAPGREEEGDGQVELPGDPG